MKHIKNLSGMHCFKKSAVLCIATLFFSLSACQLNNPTETQISALRTSLPTTVATTTPTTAPTEVPATAPTEQSIAPSTEPIPTIPEFTPELWLTDPKYPTYEEYITSDSMGQHSAALAWIKMTDKTGIEFYLDFPDLCVRSSVHYQKYRVPNSEALNAYSPLCTDGKFLYMYAPSELIKVELLSGTVTDRLPISNYVKMACFDSAVLYYVSHSDGYFHIYQVYLPEMRQALLHSVEAPKVICEQFDQAAGTRQGSGALSWTIINPELLNVVEKELRNPTSQYKKYDSTELWQTKDPVQALYITYSEQILPKYERLEWLYHHIQEGYGIHALLQYTYDPVENELTTETGIICQCDFGSHISHDHFHPVEYEIAEPVAIEGLWQQLPGLEIQTELSESSKPKDASDLFYFGFANEPRKLYLGRNGWHTLLTEEPLTAWTDLYTGSEKAVYAITKDNRIIQITYDGSVCNTLYVSNGNLVDFAYQDGFLYVIEDDKILEIDLENYQCRVVLQQAYLSNLSFDGKDRLRFLTSEGLSWKYYTYNVKEAVIES